MPRVAVLARLRVLGGGAHCGAAMPRQSMLFLTLFVAVAAAESEPPLEYFINSEDLAGLETKLQESTAKLNERGQGGQTPLMMSVLSGKTEAVRLLLKCKHAPRFPGNLLP